MSSETLKDTRLEIAHVLFIDIVGYSKLLTNEQRDRLQGLNRIVRETGQFRAAEAEGKLVRVPTGDGMVLAFFTSPDAPVRCAVAISRALAGRIDLPLRMGIHSGPVNFVEDVNEKANLAGAGVNIAQRVMSCGDAGHILLSARAADDLAQYAEWKTQLHYLGEVEVKHRVRVRVASLYNGQAGNPALPRKLQLQRLVSRRRTLMLAAAVIMLLAAGVFAVWARQHQLKLRERAAVEAAAKRVKSVAVLPFENVGRDEQNAVLAGGVHREVLSNLAKVAELKVISRTSVMRYKPGMDRNVKEIGGQLNVAYIVEGSVQREGNKVRVTADLIDTNTDAEVWSETYDGEISEVLRIQAEIAQRISNQLGAKLSPRESTDLASRPTQDIAAFEAYIRARALMENATPDGSVKFREDFARAVQLLEQAVARDTKFAAAYCALTDANIQLFFTGDPRNPEYRARAEAALKEARRIAPGTGETLYAESRVIYYGYFDYPRALTTLEEAAKYLPNNAEVTRTRALLYRRFGRRQESYAEFTRTIELNPQDPFPYYNGIAEAVALRWREETDRLMARMVSVFPRLARPGRMGEAEVLRLRGEVEKGDKIIDELHPDLHNGFSLLFDRSFWKRDYAECRRLLDEAAKDPNLETDRWAKEIQLVFAAKLQANKEAALEAEKQFEEHLQLPDNRDDETLIGSLSNVRMLLGKKGEAISICEDSVAAHPIADDAQRNTARLHQLAYIYVYAGDRERALQTLARLVQVPSDEGYGRLRYSPIFDDLRKDPRFDEIIKQAQQPFPRL